MHGVERVLDSYAEVVGDPEVEAIYNPLANGLHGPWNLAAIAAGKHVLSEKPFASNADEAAEVRDAGKRAGVVVVEGFHYVYHPVTRRLHELVASGELGEIERVEVTMVNPAVEQTNGMVSHLSEMARESVSTATRLSNSQNAAFSSMVNPAVPPENPRWSLELAGGALMDLGCYALHAHRVLAPWLGASRR